MPVFCQANRLQVVQATVGPVDPMIICPLSHFIYREVGHIIRGSMSGNQVFCESIGMQYWQRPWEQDQLTWREVSIPQGQITALPREGELS